MTSKNFSDRMRAVFQDKGVDALIIERPVDLFYLTGLNLSLGTLIISKRGGHLFVDKRYLAFAQKKGPCRCENTTAEGLTQALSSFKKVGFDSVETSYERWKGLSKLAKTTLVPLKKPTDAARALKSDKELKALQKSAALLWKGFQFLKKNLKLGMTEKHAASVFELYCLENGAEGMAFEPIVAFGKNTAFPHYRPGSCRLKKGDTVLLDLGVTVDHYHSDMTRTFFVGKPDARLVVFESVVKKAHAAALLLCRPGVHVAELDKAAQHVVEKAGLCSYRAHGLGHGIGLEVHEFPRIKAEGEDRDVVLKQGMVITIEPGLYWEGVGGYRHEDTILITRTGYENWYQ